MTVAELDAELKSARLSGYGAARARWPVPLAGWSFLAAVMSGMIFLVALGYAALVRIPFMQVRLPDQGAVFMAMGAMLLFWPVMVAAMWSYGRPFRSSVMCWCGPRSPSASGNTCRTRASPCCQRRPR